MNDASPDSIEPPPTAVTGDNSPAELQQLLAAGSGASAAGMAAFWRSRTAERKSWDADSFRKLARWLVEAGEPLLAFDVAREALEGDDPDQPGAGRFKGDVELRQIQGLALARTGATEKAREILSQLRKDGSASEETLGLLARTHKDLALQATDPAERQTHFREALAIYEDAYRTTGGYWTGINVATLHLFLDEPDAARAVADEVRTQCLAELERLKSGDGDPYWTLATLGEAALLRGEWAEAADWYGQAVPASNGEWGNVSSTRKQARLIMDRLDRDRAPIEACLRVPAVVVFVGHMIDREGRPRPRFPAQLEPILKQAILDRLRELKAGFGYSSGAWGSDLLFQECLRELGGETNLILPYPEAEYVADSVAVAEAEAAGWKERFEASREHAAEVIATSRHRLLWGGVTYEYANDLLLGRAQMHAEQLQTDLIPLAVWDGLPGDGPGGTASVVDRWRKLGHAVEIIRLNDLLARANIPATPGAAADAGRVLPPILEPEPPSPHTPEVRSILFADLAKFGSLDEIQIIAFLDHVLHQIAEFAAETPHAPRIRNTWGDGLFCVFDRVRDAALFALGLQEIAHRADWKSHGLPENLSMRIGLHAGPVFPCTDPFTTEPTYLGDHVNLASRIEPATESREIYASWAFAALARAERVDEIAFDYVGRLSLKRIDDPLSAYRVRRA